MKYFILMALTLVFAGSVIAGGDCDHGDCGGEGSCDDCTCEETVEGCAGDCCECDAEECEEACTCECDDCEQTVEVVEEKSPCGGCSGNGC
ncbi:MAG: hypothetical protein KAR40_11615 [Candidatus Sabulitectum sp.]|nr:hypothetical protein [Candidatus Sabulitectum sp.]